MDWIGGIAAQTKFISGTGLSFDGAKVVGYNGIVTNGPFGEIKETLGGYVMVKRKVLKRQQNLPRAAPFYREKATRLK